MRIALLLLLFARVAFGATTFTEFYVDNTAGAAGSNVFSGSTSSATPIYSSFSGTWNGTSTFTPTDGSTPANTMAAGDWVSVYTNGVVVTGYVVKVLTIGAGVNGVITCSTTALAGTAPGANTGGMTLRDGGAWHGPGTRDQVGGSGGSTNYFPFDFAVGTLTNAATQPPCVNFKAGTTYTVTNAITHSKAGPVVFAGYTTNPRDGGMATIDGGTAVPYYVVIAFNGNDAVVRDFIFSNNGGSGTAANGVAIGGSSSRNTIFRCVIHDMRQAGLIVAGANNTIIECEAYLCNKANSANQGGFNIGNSGTVFVNCISHGNTGVNNSGWVSSSGGYFYHCIAHLNQKDGINFLAASSGNFVFEGCDFYQNSGSGININSTAQTSLVIENCNFLNNAFGINSVSALRGGYVLNCGFGSGTVTNTSGGIAATVAALQEIGSVTYAANVTPWVDPANGNFSINLPAAKAAGRGAFTETATSYSGTVGYPDIGAAQSASTNGGFASGFAQ